MSITSSDGLVTSNMHLYQYIPIYIVIRFGVRSNLGCLIEVFLVEQEQLSHVPIPRLNFWLPYSLLNKLSIFLVDMTYFGIALWR
ncbi:hypothetical protein BHE74_00059200 [Ensete ventricosum]|nr:hypothetical protein BHE74_00059200 [Ensete ventricosum]RZS29326.1 hypothetical protein BHM03_00063042 [Ensete ventricosum]